VAEVVDMLKRVPLFAGLESKELQSIADSMRQRTFKAGSTVTKQGQSGAGFFVIESGEADVTVNGEHRATIRGGDYFGEIALLTGSSRTATITATTDLHCYGMTPWDFRPLVEGNPNIAWKLLQAMAQRMS
jgi:CRP-like cAMP-binding protein